MHRVKTKRFWRVPTFANALNQSGDQLFEPASRFMQIYLSVQPIAGKQEIFGGLTGFFLEDERCHSGWLIVILGNIDVGSIQIIH